MNESATTETPFFGTQLSWHGSTYSICAKYCKSMCCNASFTMWSRGFG